MNLQSLTWQKIAGLCEITPQYCSICVNPFAPPPEGASTGERETVKMRWVKDYLLVDKSPSGWTFTHRGLPNGELFIDLSRGDEKPEALRIYLTDGYSSL